MDSPRERLMLAYSATDSRIHLSFKSEDLDQFSEPEKHKDRAKSRQEI